MDLAEHKDQSPLHATLQPGEIVRLDPDRQETMSAVESMNLDQLIDQLGDNIDDLGAALEPFFKAAIAQTATKLPLLDRAKLYAIVTYSIESILFCTSMCNLIRPLNLQSIAYIRLNGSNAKNHPVFRELVRVKQYFEKIKTTEVGESKRTNLRLDQAAAGRFITHALVSKYSFSS